MARKAAKFPPFKDLKDLRSALRAFNDTHNAYIERVLVRTSGKDKGSNVVVFDDEKKKSPVPTLKEFSSKLTKKELADEIELIERSENLVWRTGGPRRGGAGKVLFEGNQTKWVALFDRRPVGEKSVPKDALIEFTDATKERVSNRGKTPPEFLQELVEWGRRASNEIFKDKPTGEKDVYASIEGELGPYRDLVHRRACMLEAMRVLAGFESSWRWDEGIDKSKAAELKKDPKATEAGAWQVSADSVNFGKDLKKLVTEAVGSLGPLAFQKGMKENHSLAMEYIARLLRHTIRHNGPVVRGEINKWLRKDAVKEFQKLLA